MNNESFEIVMRVTLLGTGTSYPDIDRVQSGIMVEADNSFVLFDIGSGILHRLTQTGVELKNIAGVFISHFHIDHWSDFLTLVQTLWLIGYEKSLPLFGPPHLKEWLRGIFDIAAPFYRDKIIIEPHFLLEKDAVQCGPFTVSTCSTIHGNHDGRAFKIEHQGKSIVFSSDTGFSRDLIELATGIDLLIHECNWLDGPRPEGVHTSPTELMRIAEEACPKRIVLTHMMPEVVEAKEEVLDIVRRRTSSEVIMGLDLLTIDL